MENVVNRRLLLAKEFYLNGEELSRNGDPLSKMMAVHHFHIAIEIAVKSILLKYEIRSEKTLNVDFESMLNEVDRHQPFQEKSLRLPYRQEIRNLNQMRNLVQHHATEPTQNSMDDWRVFSIRFLSRVFSDYFEIDFDEISRISSVTDPILRKFLNLASNYIAEEKYESAACLVSAVFEYAVASISNFIPVSSASFFVNSSLSNSGFDFDGLRRAFDETHKRISESEHFTALIASGLKLNDYKKYKDLSPVVSIAYGGRPYFQIFQRKEVHNAENTTWMLEFVVASLMKWQHLSLSPGVVEHCRDGADEFLEQEIAQRCSL